MTIQDLKSEMRLCDFAHDPWGTAMSWHFAVAEQLHFTRATPVPEAWQFKPGMSYEDQDFEGYEIEFVRLASDEVLVAFGNLLRRYTALLERKGLSY